MGTALAPSMKKESAVFVGIPLLERRFNKVFPFFLKKGKLGTLFVCYFVRNFIWTDTFGHIDN
jgi:hypothetical protein